MQIKDISSFPGFKNIETHKETNSYLYGQTTLGQCLKEKRITYILMIELLLIMNYAFNILFFFKIFWFELNVTLAWNSAERH